MQTQLAHLLSLLPSPSPESGNPSPPPEISKSPAVSPDSGLPSSKPSAPPLVPTIKVAPPEEFDGTLAKAETFISQLTLYFLGRKVQDNTDRIVFTLSYMKGGTAGPWAKMKVKEYSAKGEVPPWEDFLAEFRKVFGDPDPAGTARHKLSQLRQGNLTADEYVARFRELKEDTLFNDAALVERFQYGLNSSLVDRIYSLPEMPSTLDGWVHWAIKLDRQWREREATKRLLHSQSRSPSSLSTSKPRSPFTQFTQSSVAPPPVVSSSSSPAKQPDVVPMEVDSGWKSVRPPLVCFKCRKRGHKAAQCTSPVNINSMDYDSIKAYVLQEAQKEVVTTPPPQGF